MNGYLDFQDWCHVCRAGCGMCDADGSRARTPFILGFKPPRTTRFYSSHACQILLDAVNSSIEFQDRLYCGIVWRIPLICDNP